MKIIQQFYGRVCVLDDVNSEELMHHVFLLDADSPDAALALLREQAMAYIKEWQIDEESRPSLNQIIIIGNSQLISDGPMEMTDSYLRKHPESYRSFFDHR